MCLPCRSWAFCLLGAITRVGRCKTAAVKDRQAGEKDCADGACMVQMGQLGPLRETLLYTTWLAFFPFSTATVGIRQGGSGGLPSLPWSPVRRLALRRQRIGPALLVIHPWGGEHAALSWTGLVTSCVMAKASLSWPCLELYSRLVCDRNLV